METGGAVDGRDTPLTHLPTGGRRSATPDRGQLYARNLATARNRVNEGPAAQGKAAHCQPRTSADHWCPAVG
jgi:hypothetical protein